ncbi:hypothetical protein GUITHDRAFT_114715 [Guillardia theta CCMP2712]|uniref:Prokaryotic-type class I peptide chain release factors domain-containing protein n=1 Tax=Guillardia theta (strain CCMP2712) TaxID=905079 RepID=L1ITU4_GUITC|nr:hypothetical protein GUITHDRAFT_114715 [Guillardia theta CCMP2712]EKX39279.1 hypothetical protein GUITHDRAFT_114715 [Guillardia theta CCMP2712]|eukprot:XP_005826259.1 hypothetical protein GUITHDRAFT_114715 [Guillardia theta CCMP2712]
MIRAGWGKSNTSWLCTRPTHILSILRKRLIHIPYVDESKLIIKFARSSGPGGQHVNKTESKVDMRVRLQDINLPKEAMIRLKDIYSSKINKNDELVVTSEEHKRNYNQCMEKLNDILTDAATLPKERNMNSKTKGKFNDRRLEEKKQQSMKKLARRNDCD